MRSTAIKPPAAPLTDGTVSLRYRRASDLGAIGAASEDPQARRWLSDPPMDAKARAASMARVAEAFRSGRAAPLMIADSATDQPIGLLNVQFRDDQVATIAYSVFPAHRGQGVAPRAVRLAVDWALSDLGVHELLLEIDPENVSSLRVAEKCGFTPAGQAQADERDEPGKLVFAVRRTLRRCIPGSRAARPRVRSGQWRLDGLPWRIPLRPARRLHTPRAGTRGARAAGSRITKMTLRRG